MNTSKPFELLKEYYEQTHLVSHQIDSYNYFISHGMQAIVDREADIPVYAGAADKATMLIKFGKVHVEKPKFIHPNRTVIPLFPNEARQRNISYEGTIYASLKIINLETRHASVHEQIPLGKIPVMLHSNICNLNRVNGVENYECSKDHGGYFIIKGKERVLVGQLRRAYNRVYVEAVNDDKYNFMAEIRSCNPQGMSILIQLKIISATSEMYFSLPYIKSLLPAGMVFKVLGISTQDMISYCRIKPCVHRGKIISTLIQQYDQIENITDAIDFIAAELNDEKKDATYVQTILTKELFYHLGNLTPVKAGKNLGYMIKKLVDTVYNGRALDDKDNLANKRLDGVNSLISFVFQGLFKQFIKTVTNQMKGKKNPDPITVLKSVNNITYGLNMVFLSGQWNTQKSSSFTRLAVSQVLASQNFNYGSKLSHLRRIESNVGKKGKNPNARQLHSSHFSFICPYETPEGDTVGIVCNLALSATITCESSPDELYLVISHFNNFQEADNGPVLILINGAIVGTAKDGLSFTQEFLDYRESDMIDKQVSIVWIKSENEIHLHCDDGRLIRPLFSVNAANKAKYQTIDQTWDQHVSAGNIVFREVWELEYAVVAMSESDLTKHKCDYLEIYPAGTMMAVMASVIPLSNHSQSPRNAYQASMGKQAIGIPSEAFQHRYDTTLNVLNIPQQPLARNELIPVLHFNEMSHGANPVVAIMTYMGFNQEDSIILNKSSIDRGLFTVTTYKTIVEEEKKRGSSDFETICLPKIEYRNRNFDYSLLNEQGLVWKKSTYLTKNTVIIGKTTNKMVKNEQGVRVLKTRDASIVIKQGEECYLDSVLDTMNNEGVRVVKVRVRIPKIPEIGDKFASSTAQKGTCGMIYGQHDMPYDKNGICPDLIINPHAIPSRMTINMLIEMCFNLVGCKLGLHLDVTSFKHENIEKELSEWAERASLSEYTTTLYSAFTGEKFPNKIFMAPCFYQRLKHMVVDKIHARVSGPLDTLTHQPVAGRTRDGGLRFGEMEKDCMLSHGSTRILKECLFDKSDKYTVPVCSSCGTVPNKRNYCDICQDDNIETKNMPYATKLFYQELTGMGIKLSIK